MAGAGYKLYSTGDVLTASDVNTYIQQQTVMVFADASARTTALTGVVAEGMLTYLKDTDVVQYYSGSGWVTVNTDQTPLTTKGDLFTYSTQDARLAVGNNGETLVADSSTSTGLRYNPMPIAQPAINGGLDIWQRGTSFNATGRYYFADRWEQNNGGTAITLSRQNTSDTTNLPFIQYCARAQRTNGSTSTASVYIGQSWESATSIPFAGRTVTISWYARVGANFSGGNTSGMNLYSGTGTDQNINTGFTNVATVCTASGTLTTTWQRFTATGTVSSSATQLAVQFSYAPTGTAGANDWIEFTGLQLDLGSVALPFRRSGGTLAGELAACQRYFWAPSINDNVMGNAYSTSAAYFAIPYAVPMRVVPTPTYPGTLTSVVGDLVSAANRTPTAVASYVMSGTDFASWTATGMTGLVAGYPVTFRSNITWSAEL